jgi:hypothetical protein
MSTFADMTVQEIVDKYGVNEATARLMLSWANGGGDLLVNGRPLPPAPWPPVALEDREQ